MLFMHACGVDGFVGHTTADVIIRRKKLSVLACVLEPLCHPWQRVTGVVGLYV